MSASAFYTGDLTPLNDAHVSAQDADTRAAESYRNYLYHLALAKAERERTAANERIAGRDADVRQNLGTGQINLGYRGLDVNERTALARMALDDRLGTADIAMRGRGIDTAAATAREDIASRERLGLKGFSLQELLGLADTATKRKALQFNYDATVGDQNLRRELGGQENATRRELGLGQIANNRFATETEKVIADENFKNKLAERALANTGAVDVVREQGKFAQPNYHLLDSIYQNNAVADETNANAAGAAARANVLIPSAIEKLGVNDYNGMRFLPGYHSRAEYQRAVTDPNGDPGLKADVWKEVFSRVAPSDLPYLIPGSTNIVPQVRPRMMLPGSVASGVAAGGSPTAVDQDRAMALDAIRRAASFPDGARRAANIEADFVRRNGVPLR